MHSDEALVTAGSCFEV